MSKAGIFYRHDAAAPERQVQSGDVNYDRYRGQWEYACCQVNTAQGGYAEERDDTGKVVREHRARPDQLRGDTLTGEAWLEARRS